MAATTMKIQAALAAIEDAKKSTGEVFFDEFVEFCDLPKGEQKKWAAALSRIVKACPEFIKQNAKTQNDLAAMMTSAIQQNLYRQDNSGDSSGY